MKVAARGIGPVVVLGEPRVSDHELASSSVGHLVAVGAGQPDLLSGYRLATGPGLAQLILGSEDRVDARLGGAVELPQHLPDQVLGARLQRVRAGGGAQKYGPQRSKVARPRFLGVEQAAQQRGRHHRRRHAMLLDEVERSARLELRLHHDGAAEQMMQRAEHRHSAVIAGSADEMHVLCCELKDRDHLHHVLDVDAVRAPGSFRMPRGA